MIGGYYTAVSAMAAMMAEQQIIGNNLANLNTIGYKQDIPQETEFERILFNALVPRSALGKMSEATGPVGRIGTGVELLPIFQTSFIGAEITFINGLGGCPEWKRFLYRVDPDQIPIAVLENLDDPAISLSVIDLFLVKSDYAIDMSEANRLLVELKDAADAAVLAIPLIKH